MAFRFAPIFLLTVVISACAQSPQPAAEPAAKPDPAFRSAMMGPGMESVLRAEEPKIKERVERIDTELRLLDRASLRDTDWAKEWAGTYYEGDGLGENVTITLAPKAGVAFLNYGCLGLYGGDHGDVLEALPDGLRLKLVFGNARNSFLSERIYFVKWGAERFLVPDWLMLQMVNNYNQEGFTRSSMFGIPRLLRDGAPRRMWDEAPDGRPELPPQFAKLLLTSPVSLKVSKVSADTRRGGRIGKISVRAVHFDAGSDKGIFTGMEFGYPKGSLGVTGTVRITGVTPTSSIGEFTAFFNDEQVPPIPTVGETISSSDEPAPVSQ